MILFNDLECYQLEIIQSFDLSLQSCGLAYGKQTVDVVLFLHAHNADDGTVQQVAVFAHVASVLRLLVEGCAERAVILLLALAHTCWLLSATCRKPPIMSPVELLLKRTLRLIHSAHSWKMKLQLHKYDCAQTTVSLGRLLLVH